MHPNTLKRFALAALPFCAALSLYADASDIVINEMRSTGDYDYIELYNKSATPYTFTASEWVVKDSKDEDNFAIPGGTTIAGNGFLLLLVDNTTLPAGAPATALLAQTGADFGLGKGDMGRLFHNSNLMDSHTITADAHADTEGRYPDGSDTWEAGLIASPEAANQTAGSVVFDPASIMINEVCSNAPCTYDFIELYNTGISDYTFAEGEWVVKDGDDAHAFAIPAGTVIKAGGHLLILPDSTTLPEDAPSSALIAASGSDFGLGKGDSARLYYNTTLVHEYAWASGTHAASNGSIPDGNATISVGITPTPGLINQPASSGDIVINEVCSNAPCDYDFIELYNKSASNYTFSGTWEVKDNDNTHSVTIPADTTIPANGFLLVAVDDSSIPAGAPADTIVGGANGFGLGKGDSARLFQGGVLKDSFTWPSDTHAGTLGRFADGAAWSAKTQAATPGEANAFAATSGSPSDIMINEVRSTGDFDYIELYNGGTLAYAFAAGEWVVKDSDDAHAFAIAGGTTIDAKGFLVLLVDNDALPSGAPAGALVNSGTTFGLGKGDSARLYHNSALMDSHTITSGSHADTDGRLPDGGSWHSGLAASVGGKNRQNPAQTLSATILDFSAFNAQEAALEAQGMRVFGPNATLAQDVEPEYVAIAKDGSAAWVSLQENNAIAKITLGATPTISAIYPLGYKDHGLSQNAIDANDKDGALVLKTYPGLYGIYQPDGIATFKDNGVDYVISANEGDVRDWFTGFDESSRVSALDLDDTAFANEATLKTDAEMGRLTVTKNLTSATPETTFDTLHVFGGRSFSIWNGATGAQVFDSGSDIAMRANAAGIHPDGRSDNKGNEPESVAVGMVGSTRLAFVALERSHAVIVYDITNPSAPVFSQILTHTGDEAPEGVLFIDATQSPSGKALLVVSNEDSGTVSVYENGSDTTFAHKDTIALEGGTAAAEISAFDPVSKKLFVINNSAAAGSRIDVIDMSNPANLTASGSIDITPYGSAINSVSVRSGLVAGALEGFDRQGAGSVVIFSTTDYALQGWVEVGAQPDMVTFSSDGKYLITADEGEPSTDYSADPLGSVSIITMPEAYLDTDGDHVPDSGDNAPTISNTDQNDSDSDGQGDVAEQGPSGDNPNFDGNNDGTPDKEQAYVQTVTINGGSAAITVTLPKGSSFANGNEKAEPTTDPSGGDLPEGVTFPLGMIDIDVVPDSNGHAVVEIFLPAGVSANSYYKYTATPDNQTPHWYEFLYDGTTGAIISGNKITLHFQDGQRGDDDLSVNGHIDDQGGPVTVATAVPLFGPFGYLLLVSLMGLVASRRLKA
ncbi:MAG: choice-of-anchor I family protein [Campylobacterales bacterium]|nr:choice-of-anchor I family protein [Campylobacterales bacterium]